MIFYAFLLFSFTRATDFNKFFATIDGKDPLDATAETELPSVISGGEVAEEGASDLQVLYSLDCHSPLWAALALEKSLTRAGAIPSSSADGESPPPLLGSMRVTRLVPEGCGSVGVGLFSPSSRAWYHPTYRPLSPFYGDRLNEQLDPVLSFLYGLMHWLQHSASAAAVDQRVLLLGPATGNGGASLLLRPMEGSDLPPLSSLRGGHPMATSFGALWEDSALARHLLASHSTPLFPSLRPAAVRLPLLIARSDLARLVHMWLTVAEDMLANPRTHHLLGTSNAATSGSTLALTNYAYSLASSSIGFTHQPVSQQCRETTTNSVESDTALPDSCSSSSWAVDLTQVSATSDTSPLFALMPDYASKRQTYSSAATATLNYLDCSLSSLPLPERFTDAAAAAGGAANDDDDNISSASMLVDWLIANSYTEHLRHHNVHCRARLRSGSERILRLSASSSEAPAGVPPLPLARVDPLPGRSPAFGVAQRPVDEVTLHLRQLKEFSATLPPRLGEDSGDSEKRIVIDGVLSDEECARIILAANDSLVQGNMYPSMVDIFAALGFADLNHVSLPDKAVLMRARNRARHLTQRHFGLKQLYVDTSQITRRNAHPTDTSAQIAHGVHADNCGTLEHERELLRPTGRAPCRRHLGHCCYWRDYSSLLFLNKATDEQFPYEGGEFFFENDDGTRQIVEPRCGRLVAFSAGDENRHGVHAVRSGHRFVLAQWLTIAPNHRELLRNEQFFLDWYAHGADQLASEQDLEEDETKGQGLTVSERIQVTLVEAERVRVQEASSAAVDPKTEL